MKSGYFEVQHLTLAEGWVNTWLDDQGSPVRFHTRGAAVAQLRSYLRALQDDVRRGSIRAYDKAEFRVSEVRSR